MALLMTEVWCWSSCGVVVNLNLKFQKRQKSVQNYAKWYFHLICRCLHGNSEHDKQIFEHSLGNYVILPLLCECKMHELRNFKFSKNLRLK